MKATAMSPCSVVRNGDIIRSNPKDHYLGGQVQDVELLLGFNADEGYMFIPFLGATDYKVKTKTAGEKLAQFWLMAMGFPSITADRVVTMVSPLYFDQCGNDTESLTQATSEILSHIIIEPGVLWTAKHHSRKYLSLQHVANAR